MRRSFYWLWVLGLSLATIGAAVDSSYHFAHVFDEFSLPHLTYATGIALIVALLLWSLVLERERVGGAERKSLLRSAMALGLLLVSMPLDYLWHVIAGVDITTWSATHLLFGYSFDLVIIFLLCAWLASPGARQRSSWAITLLLSVIILASVHFPLFQEEYGFLAIDSLQRTGHAPWYIAPDLWALGGGRAVEILHGGAPDWIYLVYSPLCVCFALTLGAVLLYPRTAAGARRVIGFAWPWRTGAATAIAAGFIALRLACRAFFSLIGYPVSIIPWYLILMGAVLDAAFLLLPAASAWLARLENPALRALRARPGQVVIGLGGALTAVALFAGVELTRAAGFIVPPAPLAALPFACVTGAIGALFAAWLAAWIQARAAERVTAPAPEIASALALRDRILALAGGRRGR